MSNLNISELLHRNSISVLPFRTHAMPVEPISILSTVLATSRAVHTWLKNKDRKDSIIIALTIDTQRLCNVLQPLQELQASNKLNKNVVDTLLDIAGTLTIIKEHLVLWQAKKTSLASILGFLSPAKVIELLKDDQLKLTERINLLSLALQIASLSLADGETETEGEKTIVVESPHDYLEGVANSDVRDFWSLHYSQDIFAPASSLPPAVATWVGEELNEHISNALMRAVDSKDIGVVTPKTLATFADGRTIRKAVSDLREAITESESQSMISTVVEEDRAPMLVWIDDNPHNNSSEVEFARELGINVVLISSTAVARVWIEQYQASLKQLESVNKLRFITDNARWENDRRQGEFMNLTAGAWTLRYLRSLGFTSPILVYCGASIIATTYVQMYTRAGSTVSSSVCQGFIQGLADGPDKDDGSKWEGFHKQ